MQRYVQHYMVQYTLQYISSTSSHMLHKDVVEARLIQLNQALTYLTTVACTRQAERRRGQ
jgi:hypothetical protein